MKKMLDRLIHLHLKLAIVPIFALTALLLTACPSPKPKNKQPKVVTVMMGDPEKLIENATLISEIPGDYFNGVNRVQYKTAVNFTEIGRYLPGLLGNPEDGNEASSGENDPDSGENELVNLDFDVISKPDGSMHILSKPLDLELLLTRNSSGNYSINSIRTESKKHAVKLLHFSTTSDGRFFSFLISSNNDPLDGKTISAVYFSKGVPYVDPKEIDKNYFYLNGPGLKYNWNKNQTLELSICNNQHKTIDYVISDSVFQWQRALDGILKLSIKESTKMYPFSDLNQHCILVIDGYIAEPNPGYAQYGMTLYISDQERHHFVDGDVFILANEFSKFGMTVTDSRISYKLNYTILHELGHLLGLHHQFSGVESIMSYNFDGLVPKLYDYDYKAIAALYKD